MFSPLIFTIFIPTHKRAKFLSNGNCYKIYGSILKDQKEEEEALSYRGKFTKPIKRGKGVMDIYIKSKYFGDRFWPINVMEKNELFLCGLTNGDEVVEYLNAHC